MNHIGRQSSGSTAVKTLDDMAYSYASNGIHEAKAKVWLPEGRTLVKEDSLLDKIGNFAKRFGDSIVNYLPIYSSLKRNDRAIDNALKIINSQAKDGHLKGTDLWDAEYSGGVNNRRTRKALRDIVGSNYTIDGPVQSSHLWKNILGLDIYKGKDRWDTFKRNARIGGETSALLSAALLATGGSMIYATYTAGTGASALSETTQNNIYSTGFGYGLGSAFLGLSCLTGDIPGALRSTALLANQYLSGRSKGDINTASGKGSAVLSALLSLTLIGGIGVGLVGCRDADSAISQHIGGQDGHADAAVATTGAHAIAADGTSDLPERYSPNDPLWNLFDKADRMDGNPNGKATIANFQSVLQGDDAIRYQPVNYFATNHVGGLNINPDTNDVNLVEIQDVNSYLKNYLLNHFNNLSPRHRIGGGDLRVENGEFKFDFTVDDDALKRKIDVFDAREKYHIGYTPDESDIVVRIFSHGVRNPVAIADIGQDGTSDGIIVFDRGSYRPASAEETQTIMGDLLNQQNSHVRGKFFAEASFVDRNGWVGEDNVLHSFCLDPSQYKNDDVYVFDKIGRIPAGHAHRAPPAPEPWQVMCRPSGPDPDIPMKPFTQVDDVHGEASFNVTVNTPFTLKGEYDPHGLKFKGDDWTSFGFTAYDNDGNPLDTATNIFKERYDSEGRPLDAHPALVRGKLVNIFKPEDRHEYQEVRRGSYARNFTDADGDGIPDTFNKKYNLPGKIFDVRPAELEGNQEFEPRHHKPHRIRPDGNPAEFYHLRKARVEPDNYNINMNRAHTTAYDTDHNAVGESTTRIEAVPNETKQKIICTLIGTGAGYGAHEALNPATSSIVDVIRTVPVDGLGGSQGPGGSQIQ